MARKERNIRVEGIRRDPPDLEKLARVILKIAQQQVEEEAEQEAEPE